VRVAQPRRDAERLALAHAFAADFGMALADGFALLVDAAEGPGADAFERAYAPWPLRFFGVEGTALSLVRLRPGAAARLGAGGGGAARGGRGGVHVSARARWRARSCMTGRPETPRQRGGGGT
jgi:hypothetical protein